MVESLTTREAAKWELVPRKVERAKRAGLLLILDTLVVLVQILTWIDMLERLDALVGLQVRALLVPSHLAS